LSTKCNQLPLSQLYCFQNLKNVHLAAEAMVLICDITREYKLLSNQDEMFMIFDQV